jgi:citrate synthase
LKRETIRSRIWHEEAESDNPFAAARCHCHGYDVYGEVLGRADWSEYLYLLFRGDRPIPGHRRLLNDLAVALANPGPRDHSVLAAMNGGVGGSHAAACLMAALGVGAGQLGGGREVRLAMELWGSCGTDIDGWRRTLSNPSAATRADVWPEIEHAPGFDPHGVSCPTPVRQTLEHLASIEGGDTLSWLRDNRGALEEIARCPLAMTGVAAAAFVDLGFTPAQAEYLYLILRLPGAAAHALEQQEFGFRHFPFFQNAVHLTDDPGPAGAGRIE